MGSDEFTLILATSNRPKAAQALANRLLNAVAKPLEVRGHQVGGNRARRDRTREGAEDSVIAEGVETEGERSFLMLEGCEELQGYLIGRPAPAATYAMVINGDRANVLVAG